MKRIIVILFGILLLIFSLCLVMSCGSNEEHFALDGLKTTESKYVTASNSETEKELIVETEANTSMDIVVLDHDHIYELNVLVPPSCGVEGIQAYACVICGKQQYVTSIAALPHSYKRSDTLSTYPTCTTDGKEVYRCGTCGCTQEEVLKAIGHRWRTKITCDSDTNEIIITPYCTVCGFVSTSEYRYKINDAEKLIHQKSQIAEYGGHCSSGDTIIEYYLRAPYYAVFCSDTYLLIVRNTERLVWCSEFVSNSGAAGYYKRLGCTIVLEANISIAADGRIQTIQ